MLAELKHSGRLDRRQKLFDRMACTAAKIQRANSTGAPDYAALDAAFATHPWPSGGDEGRRLHQAEIVTDEAGRQFILGLRCMAGGWQVARFEILPSP